MKHDQQHPHAGQTVKITSGKFAGQEYWIEDWWDRINGVSWMNSDGNPACMFYGIRSAADDLPFDDEVVYGKIGINGHLVHVSELAEPAVEGDQEADPVEAA